MSPIHLPYKDFLKPYSQENRIKLTKPERLFWYLCLNKDKTRYRFVRQKPLLQFILDFYCAKLKLAIEIDGDTHQDRYEYDAKRTKLLERLYIKVIRFSNEQVLSNTESCYLVLMQLIEAREKELRLVRLV